MNHVENEAETGKFKVKDRRRFGPGGEPLEEPPGAAGTGGGQPSAETAETKASTAGANDAGAEAKAAGAEASAPSDADSKPPGEPETSKSEAPPASESSPFSGGYPSAPTASFELLVMSLAMQAELELGIQGKPEEQPPNLDIARHTIDMLGVLQEKTKGNLTFEEKRQLDNAVTMLRFRYVQAVQDLNQKAKA